MADSDSSSLSSAPSTDDEAMELKMSKPTGLDRYFKPAPKTKETTPEPPRRAPSPPHEYTLIDNETIAFLVMFRSRFGDAFPKSLPHYGPQDIERGVAGELPDESVEKYLCALLGLVLNRKKDVERGHYNRALEDAISTNKAQWPAVWKEENPLRGNKSFHNMTAEERLNLLRALVLWSLNQSEGVQAILKESYKQTRRDDDKNQPRSVQPWFTDSYRRRFWLIEGQEDSHFRVYRENDGKTSKTNTWFSVAGSIEDVASLADKFAEEGTSNARMNADKLRAAIPRFEQGDEKRKRRDYRQQRKAAWARPAPGFSLYEGRTRGKRARYTFDEEDEFISDGTRRSTRNASPIDAGPVVTASGRQVKSRVGGMYGESLSADQRKEHDYNSGIGEPEGEESEDGMPASAPTGRPHRAARPAQRSNKVPERTTNGDDMDTDSDEQQSEGEEWSGDEDEVDDEESEGEMSGDDDIGEDEVSVDEGDMQKSLVVQLRYRPRKTPVPPSSRARTPLGTTSNVGVEMPMVNGFGGQETRAEGPSIAENEQVREQSVQIPADPQQHLEQLPAQELALDPQANDEQNTSGMRQTQSTSIPGHQSEGARVNGLPQPQPQQPRPFQPSELTSDTTRPHAPATGLPDLLTSTPKAVSDAPQHQQQYQPQPHAMDVS
ncbi:uncharacterized protein HMPREF1541_04969 [Cyphellophora europaea CBS 101466]|uniref:WHIM1 domain-containing protein n=1 Tax=Cyphellophora europaea (strain CBS 101466) TaxID=1220924 RepID=W2RWJ1_CYPE1|nr:uncharacterized protein HMPREF1541_04969 [Cyphellophora europaea CBS 101466]ETN40690.1 hypothetical protein HMPREF1541_04969 [Cyphellophora europaea CBS 101466]